MKQWLSISVLVILLLSQAIGTIAFGGVLQEQAIPFYGCVTALAFLWAAKLLSCRHVTWIWSPLHLPVLAFTGYAIFQYWRCPLEYESRLELVQVTLYTLVYFVAASTLYRPRDRTVVLTGLVILACGESFYALWQFATKQDVVLWLDRGNTYHGRGSGTYFCPNHLAGFLIMVVCLLVAQLLIRRPSRETIEKLTVQKLTKAYLALFLLAGLWVTFSRGGWLSLIVALVFFLLWSEYFCILSSRVVLITFGLLVLLGVVAYSIPSVRSRIEQAAAFTWDYTYESGPVDLSKTSISGRETMWRPTIKMIRGHPLLGTGPGTWQWYAPQYSDSRLQIHPQYAHSDVLQVASDYGLVGFMLVVLAIGSFFWQAARVSTTANTSEERAFAVGSVTAVTAMLVHSVGDFNLHIPANAILTVTLMGLTAAMGTGEKYFSRHQMNRLPQIILGSLVLFAATAVGWHGLRISLAARAVQAADEAKQLRQWETALAAGQRALRYDPRSPAAYAQIGDIYRQQSLYLDEAAPDAEQHRLARLSIDAYRQSLRLNPFQTQALLRLAVACELADDNDQALSAYEQAVAVDPNSAFVYLQFGIFCHRIGDDTRAIAVLQKSVQLNNDGRLAETLLKTIQHKKSSARPAL